MLNISVLASHSESLPLSASSAAVQLEMAPSLIKQKPGSLACGTWPRQTSLPSATSSHHTGGKEHLV